MSVECLLCSAAALWLMLPLCFYVNGQAMFAPVNCYVLRVLRNECCTCYRNVVYQLPEYRLYLCGTMAHTRSETPFLLLFKKIIGIYFVTILCIFRPRQCLKTF